MPSLTDRPERHVDIDRRAGQYLCFPDVCLAGDGAILCAYNEFDRHVGTRRRLLVKRSADGGKTWDAPRILCATESHCPRLALLPDGSDGGGADAGPGLLALVDDAGPMLYYSADNGANWASQHGGGLGHGLQDRILALSPEVWFTTGHAHRGSQPQPKIRQAPTEQMAYLSRNRGRAWEAYSLIASEKCLVLCEASVIRLPSAAGAAPGSPPGPPRLLALMRENSFVGEPMYYAISENGGATWGPPRPTPLIGHRPTLGWTRSGKLLVTYRCVGPDPGTKAWLGTLEELCSDFQVHGLHPSPKNPRNTRQGLLVKSSGGLDDAVRYALRPITDPEFATASLEAEVLVRDAQLNGCGLHLGMWWKLYPDCLVPDCDADAQGNPALPVPYEPGRFHTIRVDYQPGLCRLFVDGKHKGDYPVDRMSGDTRPILLGAAARKQDNACEALWRKASLTIHEPHLPGGGRDYSWTWKHTQGVPDAWTGARVLELKNDRQASPADFGYSGWVELAHAGGKGKKSPRGGRFFCAYHHGGGEAPDYRPGESSHVVGTWFDEADFGA